MQVCFWFIDDQNVTGEASWARVPQIVESRELVHEMERKLRRSRDPTGRAVTGGVDLVGALSLPILYVLN
ncbi:hypothetical protein MMUC44124_22275 [Mycolicibacterium mucogenicum DSM 44124]|uniref:Uncharacterized protein n=1 Tax=Mycolicibacterium mucogenicum DSM 44124 TaxID=1226753 RepID=A0A8H2JA88_MYCMU|nr:hypothetical protein MMUC44124_22275 [Mycolicibacterium mucogenicum DSM 44124]